MNGEKKLSAYWKEGLRQINVTRQLLDTFFEESNLQIFKFGN